MQNLFVGFADGHKAKLKLRITFLFRIDFHDH